MGPFFVRYIEVIQNARGCVFTKPVYKIRLDFFVFSKNRVNLMVLDPKSKSSKRNLTEVLDEILLKIRFVSDRALYAYEHKSLANTKQLEEVSM